jgi:hypothetical protein
MAGKGVPSWEAILAALVLGFAGAVIGALVRFAAGAKCTRSGRRERV